VRAQRFHTRLYEPRIGEDASHTRQPLVRFDFHERMQIIFGLVSTRPTTIHRAARQPMHNDISNAIHTFLSFLPSYKQRNIKTRASG
jgi:hypothetical protein